MTLTVSELIEYLSNYDPEAKVYVGCEGYTTADSPEEEQELRVVADDNGNVHITDYCWYDLIDEGR